MKPQQSSALITLGAHPHEIDEKELHLLERAAEKPVRFGKQVGVTPEVMMSLLDSGISIRDLLDFLVSKTSGAA